MILYLAAMGDFTEHLDLIPGADLLVSYARMWDPDIGGRVFLDCGAFTAFNTGKPIALRDYIAFVQENGGQYHRIAALDVIGDPEASFARIGARTS